MEQVLGIAIALCIFVGSYSCSGKLVRLAEQDRLSRIECEKTCNPFVVDHYDTKYCYCSPTVTVPLKVKR